MKKLITIIIFAAAILVSGCDTTETTTIRISLGGDHRGAAPPPDDISVIYVAAYTIEYFIEWREIDATVGAAASPPTGYITMVVPENRDIFILLLAQSSEGNWFYLGTGEYPDPELPDSNTVNIYPEQLFFDGLTSFNIDSNYEDEAYLSHNEEGWNMSQLLRGVFELHIDGQSDGTYERLAAVNYYDLYNAGGTYTQIYPGGELLHTSFRSRLYVPAFGFYLHTWLEGSIPF